MQNVTKKVLMMIVLATTVLLAGCNANVGIGMSVGVPIGNHGYMSIGTGTSRWY